MANNKISLFFKSLLLGIFISGFGVNGHAATLPSGYTELEYIQGDGNSWIETNVNATNNSSAEIKFVLLNEEGFPAVFGARESKTSRAFNVWGTLGSDHTSMGIDIGNLGAVGLEISPQIGTEYTLSMSATNLTINGVSKSISNVSSFTTPGGVWVFNTYGANASGSGAGNRVFVGRIYYVKMYNNGVLALNLVPVKYVSGNTTTYGMYDTVNGQFYTNQGTGTFTAGPEVLNPCRNLFDATPYKTGYYINESGVEQSADAEQYIIRQAVVQPGTQYTLSFVVTQPGYTQRYHAYDANGNWLSQVTTAGGTETLGTKVTKTFTTPANTKYIRQGGKNQTEYQLERGSTATTYTPYDASCHNTNSIKIATTAYNSARFSPVVNDLNDTIATIRDVVTNTINQTKAIADLQATKQTRPDENCPAGKKCLLVEDNDGTPHWYEIIENAYGLPNGYTALEYIQSDGGQYIDTGAAYKSSRIYNVDFQYVVYPDGAKGSLGARQTSTAGTGTFDIGCNQIKFYFYNNSTSANVKEPRDLARHTVEIDYTNSVFKFDGETLPWTTGTGAWQGTYNIYIGRENMAGSPNSDTGTVKWYSYKVYDNGVLIQNLIPAKNSSGVIGMYDTVNGQFYTNQGTGTFTAGPEI